MSLSLPLGIDDFAKLREEKSYYIDKTVFIKQLLSMRFEANLITRPRRFGKSLTMSMLEDFFDFSRSSKAHFEGLKILEEKELCEKWMNQWPVVFLTLKSVEGLTFPDAYGMLEVIIANLCKKYAFLDVIRLLLGGDAIKTNPNLKFAVVTGCLRVAKESIFTGTNNFVTDAITGDRFNEYIGFTPDETEKLLQDAGFSDHAGEVKRWYDGYRFGKVEVYCSWAVLNYVNALQIDPQAEPDNYWANTSHNGIIYYFINRKLNNVRGQFEILMDGGTIVTPVEKNLTYDYVKSSVKNFWSLLYLSGYLTSADRSSIGQPPPGLFDSRRHALKAMQVRRKPKEKRLKEQERK